MDAVCDILTVTENMLHEPPDVGADQVREFVDAVMSTDEGIVSLLSLDNVLPKSLALAA